MAISLFALAAHAFEGLHIRTDSADLEQTRLVIEQCVESRRVVTALSDQMLGDLEI
jgi:hypothetical protein